MGIIIYAALLIIAFLVAAFFSYRATAFIITMLKKQQVMDMPNDRSNHSLPTPRGGGIAIAGIGLAGFLMVSFWINELSGAWPLIIAAWILGMVSFSDDVKGLPVKIRFFVQILAVAMGLLLLPVQALLQIEAVWLLVLIYLFIAFAWIWFINLYNFMDGIDGITGVETISILVGAAIIFAMKDFPAANMALYAMVFAGATAGFLFFNWHPASVFMGDVGSVVLGFFVGWILFQLMLLGDFIPAIILPLYYLMDSGITITKRLIAGENIFQAHSQHYYQQAVRNGLTHSQVSLKILQLNIVLIALAIISSIEPLYAYGCLPFAVVLTIIRLRAFTQSHSRAA